MRDLSQFLKIRPIRFFHQFVNVKRESPEFYSSCYFIDRVSSFLTSLQSGESLSIRGKSQFSQSVLLSSVCGNGSMATRGYSEEIQNL